ncbi:MAG: DUF4259 domain-containing protein [bacterium]
MGRWDTGVFDSDDALDWIQELEEQGIESGVKRTLRSLQENSGSGYLEMPDCEISVALATTVAVLTGMPVPDGMPEELATLINASGYKPEANVIKESLRFLTFAHSENAEIMGEGVWGSEEDKLEWFKASETAQIHLQQQFIQNGPVDQQGTNKARPRRGCLWF